MDEVKLNISELENIDNLIDTIEKIYPDNNFIEKFSN